MSQSLRGSTVTNYFKFSLAGTSTIVLYSFESPWASLCPCANTCCVRGVASARPRRASKRLDCRLWKRDLFHQHNRKGKIVMIETSRYKGLVFGFVFGAWNWYDFWRRSWGLPCNAGYTVPSTTPMTPSMPPAPTVPAAPAMPSAPAMPGSAVLFVDYACKKFRLLQWGISCFQCPLGMRQFVSQVWQVSLNLPFQGCVLVDGLQSLSRQLVPLVEFV